MKVVIVGGVAGGASAAALIAQARRGGRDRHDRANGVCVVCPNCGLPYYVGGVITDKRKLTLQTPGELLKRVSPSMRA